MWTPVRAFLQVQFKSGGWQLDISQDLEGLLRIWQQRCNTQWVVAIVHVGFEELPPVELESLLQDGSGKVFLTAAAKYALPHHFQSSDEPVAHLGGQPIFIALAGWELASASVTAQHTVGPSALGASLVSNDWLQAFIAANPGSATLLAEADIVDDASYLSNEAKLDRNLRIQLGSARLDHLVGSDENDPCAFVRAAPPWLVNLQVRFLKTSVRIGNVFKQSAIEKIGEIGDYTTAELLKLPNFGRTSVSDLMISLRTALHAGPTDEAYIEAAATRTDFLTGLRQSLAELEERTRDVLVCRMGLGCAELTLTELGERYNVTRERIRQLEDKSLKRLIVHEQWAQLFPNRIAKALDGRLIPLTLAELGVSDRWFAGIEDEATVLRFVLAAFEPPPAHVLSIDGAMYVARIAQEQWNDAEVAARAHLKTAAGRGLSEVECRDAVAALLPDSAAEFRDLLWQRAAEQCHFADNGSGDLVLVSYGRGAESVVAAILQEADRPLHYSEIFDRALARVGDDLEIRRVHQAAAEVAFLFGRGVFGLPKHLPLPNTVLEELAEQAEAVVAEGPEGRQWHASELLGVLIEAQVQQALEVDKYLLNIALQMSGELEYLGRLVWALPADEMTAQARIDVRQAIIDILRNAASPLKARELMNRLKAIRGIGQSIQLQPTWPLIRVGPALWGLADRDIPLTSTEQERFVSDLIEMLDWRGKGVHVSELWNVMPPISGFTAEAAFSLASMDDRLKVGIGQFLYLTEWGEPRRKRLSEVVVEALQRIARPVSTDEMVVLVKARFDMSADKAAISRCLSAAASYDHLTDLWTMRNSEGGDSEDDEDFTAFTSA